MKTRLLLGAAAAIAILAGLLLWAYAGEAVWLQEAIAYCF